MISDNSSLHAFSNTGYHSHSNGSWRNAPEVFLCTERPEETDWKYNKIKSYRFQSDKPGLGWYDVTLKSIIDFN